ncbi:hypothetical protein [Methanocalculus taiwanensis]|nr:hypothetical protein [Methanocalculus taiwanensis]
MTFLIQAIPLPLLHLKRGERIALEVYYNTMSAGSALILSLGAV